jgi:hypothetical protein
MKMDKEDRLDSWKEISEYLNKSVRTCFRWKKELDLPVYHLNKKSLRSKVFAYKSELDEWFIRRARENSNKKQYESLKKE